MKIEKIKLKLLSVFLLTSVSTFAKTNGQSAAGFEQIVSYISALKSMFIFLLYLIAVIYLIIKIVEFIGNFQWQEFAKAVLAFVCIVGLGFSIDAVVKALGGTTAKEKYIITKTLKIKKGDLNERIKIK